MLKCGICGRRGSIFPGTFLIVMPYLVSEDREFVRKESKQFEVVRYCPECFSKFCKNSKEKRELEKDKKE